MHTVAASLSDWSRTLADLADRYDRVLVRGWDEADEAARQAIAAIARAKKIYLCDANDPPECVLVQSSIQARTQMWNAVAVPPHRTELASSQRILEESVTSPAPAEQLLYCGSRSRFVAVVSLHKSGTHLLGRLLSQLGLRPVGVGVHVGRPPGDYPGWYEWEDAELENHRLDTAYFTHSLPLLTFRYPGEKQRTLLNLWTKDKFPMIFNYRDPRAILSSAMRYCLNRIQGDASYHSLWIRILGETLAPIASDDERLVRTIELLTDYMHRQFRDNLWLLHHPEIVKTSYELLAGPKGGGSPDVQQRTVALLMVRINAPGCPRSLASSLYSTEVRTFSRGQIDGWKEEFGEHHRRAFSERYEDIVASFGYRPTFHQGG